MNLNKSKLYNHRLNNNSKKANLEDMDSVEFDYILEKLTVIDEYSNHNEKLDRIVNELNKNIQRNVDA